VIAANYWLMISLQKKSRFKSFLSYPNGFSISAPIAAKPITMNDVICSSALTYHGTYNHGRDGEPSESAVELEREEQAVYQSYLIISFTLGMQMDLPPRYEHYSSKE